MVEKKNIFFGWCYILSDFYISVLLFTCAYTWPCTAYHVWGMVKTLVDHLCRQCSLGVWKVHQTLCGERPTLKVDITYIYIPSNPGWLYIYSNNHEHNIIYRYICTYVYIYIYIYIYIRTYTFRIYTIYIYNINIDIQWYIYIYRYTYILDVYVHLYSI